MNLVLVAAVIAVCGAAKLDRTYLPPSSSQNAGGSPGSLQTPFITSSTNQGSQQTPFGRTSDNNPSQGNQLPSGSYENEYQGVVVEAAAPGTRASNQPTGLGGPRINYGSTDSKVGEAAFRGTKDQTRPATQNGGYQSQTQFGSFQSQGPVSVKDQDYPDLSAFYKPTGQINAGNQKFTDQASNTIKSHINIGLNKFNYGFETENGIKKEETGVSDDGVKMQGGYSYTGDDGKVYSVMYTADKDGYRPMGSHLPTAPPIPVEILESLEQNARDEANGIKDDGSYDAEKYNKEDDYAQSDTNGNYNDRQSNKFGERPGFNGGAGAVINQDKPGFVRPNVQGQFNSYDSSKDSLLTQSFGTASGQSNKADQTESNAGPSTFFNQDQQGFVSPNIQEPSSSYDFSKDSSSMKPDITKFGPGISNKGNNFAQNGPTTQFSNRFGAQSQYLPPRPPGNFLDANSILQIDSTKVGFYNNAQPDSEQKQDIGTSFGQASSKKNLLSSTQGSNSFGLNSNYNRPQNGDTFFQTSIQSSLIGISNSELSQENIINNPQSQGSFSQTSFQNSADSHKENTNPDFSNRFSSNFSSQTIPTKQPALILTTPLENQEQQADNGFSLIATSIDSHPQKAYSINSGNSQSIISSNERLSDGQFNSNLPEQAQDPDNSYIYNTPSKPFNTAPSTSSGSVNSISQQVVSLFPNAPEGSVFSVEYQSATGSNKYPQPPTLAAVAPTPASINQSNGITQASISPFPSIKPTSSSQMNSGEVYVNTKPAQELPASSQEENAGESNTDVNQQSSVPSSQNKDTINSQVSIDSNTQFGQRFPTTSTTLFGQQIIPSQFGIQTSSTFGQKPTQLQFGEQGTSSFGQIPTLSSFGSQTGSPFGQKLSQQQFDPQTTFSFGQQTTPSFFNRFSAETSSPFHQKQTFSPFVGQTSTSLNQQMTPIDYSAQTTQTSSSFGPKPSQPQNNFSFGQQTTPSRFGVQTSSSFGHQTLSPFGSQTFLVSQTPTRPQTSFSFGQNPSQPHTDAQSSFSFGSQKPSSGSGGQIGSSFDQKTNLSIRPSCCTQTSAFVGQQTKPSRFGIQTGSIFGQKPTQAQLGGGVSSFGPQTTPSPFGVQTSSSLEQQTTPSRFGLTSISSSGQQTTPLTFGGQVSSIFAQKFTTPKVEDSSFFPQLLPTQNGVDDKPQQIQSQESNESSEKQSNSKPLKLQPSISNSQNSQDLVENTSSDEVYQYNKPTTTFSSNQQSQGSTQFGQLGGSTQPDEHSFSSTSQNKDSSKTNQQSQVTLFPRFPEQSTDSQLGLAQPTKSQFVAPTSSIEQSLDSKELTSTDFSRPSPTFIPSSPNSQSALNIQKPQQSHNSEPGEVHHYNKLTHSLPVYSQNENTQFGQNTLQEQITGQSVQNKLDTTKPVTSHLSQSNDKFENDKLPMQSDQDVDQTDSKPQKASTSSLGILPSSHPFPHLTIYSACCRGSKLQNSQGSQSLSSKVPSLSLIGNLGGNSFGSNKNDNNQDTNKSALIENKFGSQGFGVEKDTPSANDKFENDKLPMQSDEDVDQTDKPQKASSSSLGILPSSHPFPHLTFYSACCQGSKLQNSQGSQSLSSKVPSSYSIGNLGGYSFGFNKNDNNQDSNKSGLIENKFGNQGFGVEKDTPSTPGKGEEFGGPRNPAKFDETGYHY